MNKVVSGWLAMDAGCGWPAMDVRRVWLWIDEAALVCVEEDGIGFLGEEGN